MKLLRSFFLLLLCLTLVEAKRFTLASYNVENLFDLYYAGSEYPEYIPNTKSLWNQKHYKTKLQNIAQVIRSINPDIIGLCEIESRKALKDLRHALKTDGVNYPYWAIADKKKSSVHTALLSKFPIIKQEEIAVNPYDHIRSILKVTLNIEHQALIIYVNHWKSKGGPESKRIPYAKALNLAIKKHIRNVPYLIIGDLNENYNEMQTFLRSRKLNNTKGVTAINHILNTSDTHHVYTRKELTNHVNRRYDLWMELPKKDRWSHIYRKTHGSLDHIILSSTLLDKKGIDYIPQSFNRFKPYYLVKKGHINRWKMSRYKYLHHTGHGYSDHLPIFAKFSY